MPLSSKEIIRLYESIGYHLDKSAGKGSHIKMVKRGKPPQIIPKRKELGKGLENKLLKRFKEEGGKV